VTRFSDLSRRAWGLIASALFAGSLLAVPASAARSIEAEAALPVKWGKCAEAALEKVPPEQRHLYSCGTYPAPMDYQHPGKGTVDLAMMRRAAEKPDQRIGSLFLNPGGPGGAGFAMPTRVPGYFEQEVLDRFDTIGFDPRGIDRSTRLRCFESQQQHDEVTGRMSSVPISDHQIANTLGAYEEQGELCEDNAGELLKHMSTKDVARDLDRMREAVGDEQLTFVGFSYGTLIGATYANMFPDKTRAIVNDGNVDPALRTSNGVQYDRERAQGLELSLDAFLKRCKDVGAKCAFSDGDPRAKFDEIRERLREGAVKLPSGTELTLDMFTEAVSGNLYSPSSLPKLAEDLQNVYAVLHPEQGPAMATMNVLDERSTIGRYDGLPPTTLADTRYTDDSYFGVNCSDKPFSKAPQKVPGIAAKWEKESPTFGRFQAFSDAAGCAYWPETDPKPHSGPWAHKAETPVLVVGNYYDSATQYEFSRRMTEELGNAVLVSADAFGHCILGDSTCVDRKVTRYLVDLKTPRPGEVCQPDEQPFEQPAGNGPAS
jgi:pimeloyl-ACP methyl ester carboxylesterase